ncbi:unnamed protein product [Microthlaspi erraticum]|uniref:Uncharacterized protein n=1 Tax=Microthlaspi erraticum TaxID=1685480 RepID=A0A6D2J6U0_9BRAS|nr:unnamed protein product [Microthlaspi erraticum]
MSRLFGQLSVRRALELKEMLTTTPVLALPEPGKPYHGVYRCFRHWSWLCADAGGQSYCICFETVAGHAGLTDHKSLQHIFTQPMMNARQTRWVEFLADYQEPLGLEAVDQADLLSRIRVAQQSDQSLLDATRVTGSEYEVSANGTILVRGRVCVPKDVELRQQILR